MSDLENIDFSVIKSRDVFPKGDRATVSLLLTNGTIEVFHQGKLDEDKWCYDLLFTYSASLNRAESQIEDLIELIKNPCQESISEYLEEYQPKPYQNSIYQLEEYKLNMFECMSLNMQREANNWLARYNLLNDKLNALKDTGVESPVS
jgi:hypothetical protein